MAVASPTSIVSNWATLIDNLEASPLNFFKSVETAVEERQIPEITISRVDYHEGGITSAKREYLRVARGSLLFDICAAPYGRGFFVSWWLGIPMIHPLTVIGIVFGYFVLTIVIMAVVGLFLGFLAAIGLVVVAFWLGGEGTLQDQYILAIPGIGYIYRRFFKPATLFAMDTETMFRTATHSAVLETVDALMSAQGLRLLSESERRPTLRESLRK
jgi:hypothetical protein